MSTHQAAHDRSNDSEVSVFFALATIFLGAALAVVCLVAALMWVDARDSESSDGPAASAAPVASHDAHAAAATATGGLTSYAGAAPANADELAIAHKPYPAFRLARRVRSRTSTSR